MLSFFRQGGVAQFLVAAIAVGIIVVFVLEFRTGRGSGSAISRECAVDVAGECVDAKDFNAALGLIVPRGEVSSKRLRELSLRKQTLEGLVERELLLREADRLGIGISDDEIDEELQNGRARVSLPAAESLLAMRIGLCEPNDAQSACAVPFETYRLLPVRSTQSGAFDYKIYERVVRNTTNRSPKEFREMQRRELIATRMRDLVRSRARISEAEALTAFERDNSRAVVRSVEVKRDWMLKYAVDVSDAAVDRWIFENKEQVDEAWKGQKDQFKAGCLVANELTVAFSPGMEDDAKAELRRKIDEARVKVAAGTAFEAAALQTGSAGSGDGGPRCIDSGASKSPDDVIAAAQKLKPGELSPVIETADGFHLLKLHKKLAEPEVETVGRRAVARKLAVRFLADELAKRFSNDLITKVKGGGDLEQATRELTEQYAHVSAAKPKPAAKPAPAASAPAAEAPATSDPDRPTVDVSPPFNMGLNPVPDALPTESPATVAFAIEKPNAVHPAPIATRSGFVVMQLKEKTLAKREDFAKERQRLMRKLREAKERDAVVRYLVELRKSAESKIKVDQRFAEEPKDGNANPDG